MFKMSPVLTALLKGEPGGLHFSCVLFGFFLNGVGEYSIYFYGEQEVLIPFSFVFKVL